ncbi:MFS transporter [Rhodoferax sp. GW822-FHT02A01]|uniref:MFS transporter n=1 Tax=Rhodoferax sp. GW822-FHT02A01 TaxID=3141537 RepID=UPI00315DD8AF
MSEAMSSKAAIQAPGGFAMPASPPDIQLPRGALLGLSISAFGSGISMRVTDPLLPGLAKEFSLTLGHAALVITVFAIAYGFSQLIFGPLGDRFGKYRVIAWGTIACAITTAACAMAPSFEFLLAARAVAGASAAAIIPLAMAWIGDVTSYERRQPILARFMIGQVLGVSAGVLLGGYAADHLHWRTPFEGIAVYFALGGFLLLWMNKHLPDAARKTSPPQGSAMKRMVSEFAQVLAVPWARVVLLTVFAEGASIFGAFAFMVTHVHQVHGIPLAMAGQIVMLFGFGGLCFALSARFLVHRLGETGLCRWGGVLVAASYIIVAVSSSWWWAIPASFVSGLGFYMLHNTLQINATQMAPERRGAAVAAFAASYFIGQSAGIALEGALIPTIGTAGAIVLGAVGVTVVSQNFARLMQKHRRKV